MIVKETEEVYSAAFRRRLQWALVSVAVTPAQIEAVLSGYPQDPSETIAADQQGNGEKHEHMD
jgi:hypothetical protein